MKESTHIHEHILDWVLYREDEPILRSCTVGHNVISDHFPLLCYFNITKPRQQPALRVSRNIRAMCRPDFKADIAASVASLSEPTVAQLNEQLSSDKGQRAFEAATAKLENNVDDAVSDFVECLTSASQCMIKKCHMEKHIKGAAWYDELVS